MPGPPKTPVELTLLRGNPGKRKVNRGRPKPRGEPTKPTGLDRRASQLWDQAIRDYAHTGVLTGVDAGTLRIYCESTARYEAAAKLLAAQGPLVASAREDGSMVRNPLAIVANQEAALAIRAARELGFTPAARSALAPAGEPGEEDALTAWERKQKA